MFLRSQENVFPPERRAGSVVLANAVVAYIGIMLIPTGIVDLFALAHATPRMWLYIVALGVCQSGLGFRWMAIAQGQIGRKVAYCVILASLVAPFMGLILANDQPNMSEYCIALVIHGMVAMAVRDSLRAAPARR
ncbi:MAG: hypothetical protein H6619_05725 [Deltaproteobacteria bacterium]|nr:hypothetical protein [Deltaproteobacteria bacterium]